MGVLCSRKRPLLIARRSVSRRDRHLAGNHVCSYTRECRALSRPTKDEPITLYGASKRADILGDPAMNPDNFKILIAIISIALLILLISRFQIHPFLAI